MFFAVEVGGFVKFERATAFVISLCNAFDNVYE